MSINIRFYHGIGFDAPTKCKSGPCETYTAHPRRDGWSVAQIEGSSENAYRNGWWCPECVERMQALLTEHGARHTSELVSHGTGKKTIH